MIAVFTGAERTAGRRLTIFAASCLLKLPLAYVFLGSVDLLNLMDITVNLMDGDGSYFARLPYLPTVPLFTWAAGHLNALLDLPPAFAYKLVPIFFDSLLAVLVYDFARQAGNPRAFRAGMLYALCPVAVIIDSFHVQWESLLIFFLLLAIYIRRFRAPTAGKYVLYGVSLAASVLIKPVSVLFLPFLIRRGGARRASHFFKNNLLYAGGGLGLGFLFLAVYLALGVDLLARLPFIAGYANTGVTIIGLPFASPFSEFSFLKFRLWILAPLLFVLYFFYRGKIAFADAVLLTFLIILAVSGISPQYLFWPVALLLATGRLAAAAVYVLAASLFYLFYYMHPAASFMAGENMATFAALKSFAWAMPPAYLTEPRFLAPIKLLGNYLLPALSLVLAGMVLLRPGGAPATVRRVERLGTAYLALGGLSLLAAVWLIGLSPGLGQEVNMEALLAARLEQYAMHPNGTLFTGDYGPATLFNIFHLGLAGTVLWSAVAVWGAGRDHD